MTTVRISDDAVTRACGAGKVVSAFEKLGWTVERVSSWGMHWLEPLVEVNGVGWGPVTADRVAEIAEGKADEGAALTGDHGVLAVSDN